MKIWDRIRGGFGRVSEPRLSPIERTSGEEFAYQVLEKKLEEVSSETATEYSQKYILKRFIEGNQWSATQKSTRVQPVTDNLCAPVTEKYVSFFTRSPLKDKIPTRPSFETSANVETPRIDEEEVTKGYEAEQHANEQKLELLRVVKYEDNDWDGEITNAASNAIGMRDAFMRVVGDEKSGKVKLTSVNPLQVRIFWKSDDFKKIDGYCHVSMRSIQSIFETYGKVVGSEQYDMPMESAKTFINMARFYDGWLNGYDSEKEQYYLWNISVVGNHVVRNKKYFFDQEIEAIVHLPALRQTNKPWGKAMIEDIVDPSGDYDNSLQMHRNQVWSDKMDLARYAPNNILLGIGTNLDDKQLPTGSEPYLLEIGKDQKVEPLQLAKPLIDFDRLLTQTLQAIDDKTGMPRAAFGDLSNIDLATGIGLTTAFESATAKLQLVVRNWKPALERLNKYVYMWVEYLYPEAKDIIGGDYKTEVRFGKMQPRDLALMSTVMINQKNADLVSTETAMNELDIIDNPRQEMIKITNEKNNEWLNPELALQKIQTRTAAEAIKQKAAAEKARPQAGATPAAFDSATPNVGPEGNQFGPPQPMSQPNQQGAAQREVAQSNQQGA